MCCWVIIWCNCGKWLNDSCLFVFLLLRLSIWLVLDACDWHFWLKIIYFWCIIDNCNWFSVHIWLYEFSLVFCGKRSEWKPSCFGVRCDYAMCLLTIEEGLQVAIHHMHVSPKIFGKKPVILYMWRKLWICTRKVSDKMY